MTDILDTVKAALPKVPDVVWLSESGTGWCDDDENAAIMAVLTAVPALLDELEAARADVRVAREAAANTHYDHEAICPYKAELAAARAARGPRRMGYEIPSHDERP